MAVSSYKSGPLDEQLQAEGFTFLGTYGNHDLGNSPTLNNLSRESEDLHVQFRIVPLYLAFVDVPAEQREVHCIYIRINVSDRPVKNFLSPNPGE